MKPSRQTADGNRGFTLVEVLVALAIVGLGMLAVFSQLSQSLFTTGLIRDKTLAHWVATDRLTELRLTEEFPRLGERSDSVEMAGVEWRYTLKFSDVGVPDFRRVDVTVSQAANADRVLAEVIGFIAKPPDSPLPDGGTWPAIVQDLQ